MTPDPQTTNAIITAAGAAAAVGPTLKVIVEKMLGPIADAYGEHFGDKARKYLRENANAAIGESAVKVHTSGKEPRSIPLRTAIPLLEGASREDDPSLRDMWSSLLANAAIADAATELPPAFAHILAQLTPFDAKALQFLSCAPKHRLSNEVKDWEPLGDRDRVNASIDLLEGLGVVRRLAAQTTPIKHAAVARARPLAKIPPKQPTFTTTPGRIELTTLGRRFLSACTAPTPQQT